MTDKPTPTEQEIERKRGKQAREYIENLLRQEGYAYEVLIAAAEHYEPDLLTLLATVRAEGAREEREAVVRFLLERVAFRANGIPSHENIAEKIERGDHLKGDR